MKHHESKLQQACFGYFRLQYPEFRSLFFSVPNGAHVSEVQAHILKGEGMTSGVADAILLIPALGYHGLMVEFKTPKGRQSEHQKAWQEAVERQGYHYIIIRTFNDFVEAMRKYLCNGATDTEQARMQLDAAIAKKPKSAKNTAKKGKN